MFDDRTVSRDLAQMRRYVMWSLLPIPVAFAAMNIANVLGIYSASPLGLCIVACVVLAAWTAFVLCYWSIDGESRLDMRWFTPKHWSMFGIGLAGTVAGLLLEQLLGTGETQRQSGWPMLVAMVTAALVVNAPDGKRRRVALIAAAAAVPVIVPAAMVLGGSWAMLPLMILLLTFAMWSIWWIYGVSMRLDAARRVGAELAVAEERLRFAAELHDIQGHHLQVIALKSELAARLARADPDTAGGEMREVERLAREALTDTRAVVGDYRDVRLRTELANAVRVLTAAGINARHGLESERIEVSDLAIERLLGLAVREATTNMIRHASPSQARLNLQSDGQRIRLTVRNNGAADGPNDEAAGPEGLGDTGELTNSGAPDGESGSGLGSPLGPAGPAGPAGPGGPGDQGALSGGRGGGGSGLAALRERFTDAGGELAWQRSGDEFVVTAEVAA